MTIKTHWKNLLQIWLIVLGTCAIFFGYIYLTNHVYLFWGDEMQEVVQQTTYLYNLIHNRELSFYSFSYGMGATTFINLYSYFGSPSFYLFLLLPKAEYIVSAMPFVDILRFLLISTFAYLWVSRLCHNSKGRIIATVIFTFSGYVIYWFHYYYYMDAYLYLAILLWTLELILEHKKPLLFTLIICFTYILTLYYGYMFTWFILIYCTCRLFMIHDKLTFRVYLQEFVYIFKFFLLGVGLSCAAAIPALFILSTTNRIASGTSMLSVISGSDLLKWATSLLSPVINDYDYNIYSSRLINSTNTVYTVYTYSFILYVLLLPQIFIMKFKEKKPLLITSGLIGIMFLFPFFYFLFNGNTSVRWSFYAVVINIMIICFIFNNLEQMNKKVLLITCLSVIVLLCGITFLSFKCNFYTDMSSTVLKANIIVLSVLLLFYTWSFCRKKGSLVLICIGLFIESCYCLLLRVQNGHISLLPTDGEYKAYNSYLFDRGVQDDIKDDSFYRVDLAGTSGYDYNLSLSKNYYGFTLYSSIYNHESNTYIANRFSDTWFLGYGHSKFLLKSLWSEKYIVQKNDDDQYIPYGYTLISKNETESLYQNKISMPIGYATNAYTGFDYAQSVDKSCEDIIMLNTIVTKNSNAQYDYSDDYEKVAGDLVNDGFKFNRKDGYLFVDYSSTVPSSTINYEFYKDGHVVEAETSNEYAYTAIPVDKDIDEVYVYASNVYNTNEYVPVNVYWISYETIDRLYEKISQYDLFENTVVNGDTVTADINITKEDSYVATSIPYNKGWTVYVDGKKTDYECVNLSFVGFQLAKGKHTVEFHYTPQGFHAGLIVSSLSFAVMIAVIIMMRRKKNSIPGD